MLKRSMLLTSGFLALCASMPLLSGCDGARETLASAIKPVGATEVASALRQQIAQGKFADASRDGAGFLKDKSDTGGVVAWETAKASAQAGKLDDAIRYAGLAVEGGTVSGIDLMSEPLLEPVHTDIRFVTLATSDGGAAQATLPATAAATAPASLPANAEASIGASGVKASAGDVSVQLPE